jgi:glycosyltransferase involved in cell wall biosynthesis
MKVLLAHNRYIQPGGEDAAFAAECALLRRSGHQVIELVQDNRRVRALGAAATAVRAVWSSVTRDALSRILDRERPAVAHFHNTFPLLSPSVYYACRETGTPVVQTLHNYRLVCANALLYRDGRVCEECVGKRTQWPGVLHACYRGSRLQSAGVAAMVGVHRAMGTWRSRVDLYVALSEFARRKFIEGGLPAERIAVKPNFVYPDPGGGGGEGSYALYAGRLSPEKGFGTLLDAWARTRSVPLVIAGDGPLLARARAFAERRSLAHVRVAGRCSWEDVVALMKGARFLVMPSDCYESFPMVIGEAFACGLPVLTTSLGSAGELVTSGRTGLHFPAGDARGLADTAQWLWSRPAETRRMGREARAEFEARYTAERNYPLLLDIYARARERR